MVVHQGHEATAPASTRGGWQVERALEVDVSQLVGARALVAGSGHPGRARPVGAGASQEPFRICPWLTGMPRRPNSAAMRRLFPVAQQPHHQDRLLQFRRQVGVVPGPWSVEKPGEAPQSHQSRQRRRVARLQSPSAQASAIEAPSAHEWSARARVLTTPATDTGGRGAPRSAILRRDEQQARALAVVVPPRQPMGAQTGNPRAPRSRTATLSSLTSSEEHHRGLNLGQGYFPRSQRRLRCILAR